MIHKHAAKILSALIISDKESTQILGNVCVRLLFSSGMPCSSSSNRACYGRLLFNKLYSFALLT